MNYACIDMEGVLIPEVWPHISEKTKIKELSIIGSGKFHKTVLSIND